MGFGAILRDCASRAVAVAAVAWHGLLLCRGDERRWAYPLLGGAALCRLLSATTAPRRYHATATAPWPARRAARRWPPGATVLRTAWARRPRVPAGAASALRSLKRRAANDRHSRLRALSVLVVVLPCAVFFGARVRRHVGRGGGFVVHVMLANDCGNLSASAFCWLLVPVSRCTALPRAWRLSDVHVLRMHVWAGTLAIVAAIAHGLYFTGIWIKNGVLTLEHVFPRRACYRRDYDSRCGGQFVNLTGIVCACAMLVLGLMSAWRVRRRHYRVFYVVHVALSVVMLFGLVLHDRGIVWYMAPSLLYYLASELPPAVEGLHKRLVGGVAVAGVVHIPDSGGCVELTLRGAMAGDAPGSDNEVATVGRFCKLRVPAVSPKSHPFSLFAHAASPGAPRDEFKILFRPCGSFTRRLSARLRRCAVRGLRTTVPPGRPLGLRLASRPSSAAGAITYVAAIHPESVLAGKVQVGDGLFSIDEVDARRMEFGEVNRILLSRQQVERTVTFAPLANEFTSAALDGIDARQQDNGVSVADRHNHGNPLPYPTVLVNSVYSSCHQLDLVMQRHDDVVIIAGGVGIVTYISLLSTLRRLATTARIPPVRVAVPPGRTLGLQLSSHPAASAWTGEHAFGPRTYVSAIRPDSVLAGRVRVGDGVSALDGLDVSGKDAEEVKRLLKSRHEVERVLSFAPLAHRERAPATTPEDDEELQGRGGDAAGAELVPLHRAKRIQVHWMCRDEGLIQHVMQNYLNPVSHRSKCGTRQGNASISIKLVVHHTRPPCKLSTEDESSESTGNEDDIDSSSNGSRDELVLLPALNPAPSAAAASPVSAYEGEKSLLPSATFAAIGFGGMWIIQYCSAHIDQGRQAIENRLAPVVGIILLSLGISILSYAATKIGELFFSKIFAYSRLDTSACTGDVEFSNDHLCMELPEGETSKKDNVQSYDSINGVHQQAVMGSLQDAMEVLHLQGRPDLTDVIKEAILFQKRIDTTGSLGLFVCGPNVMNDAVGQAIGTVGKENVYLYQEVFEL